ncbi:MAG: hypothetical protein RR280_04235 [Bacteroidaceae bacterium]
MATNPFTKKGMKESTIGRTGMKSETRLSVALNMRQTPASGAMLSAKSDMVGEGVRIEAKSTTTNTLSVQYGWCIKITEEAISSGRMPALTLSFTDEKGKGKRFGEWVAIPLHKYQELVENGALLDGD